MRNSRQNKAPTLGIPQNCCIPWKFQGKKTKPMEIPHDFYLVTPGNSTSFVTDYFDFHILFLQYPWKFQALKMSVSLLL